MNDYIKEVNLYSGNNKYKKKYLNIKIASKAKAFGQLSIKSKPRRFKRDPIKYTLNL